MFKVILVFVVICYIEKKYWYGVSKIYIVFNKVVYDFKYN